MDVGMLDGCYLKLFDTKYDCKEEVIANILYDAQAVSDWSARQILNFQTYIVIYKMNRSVLRANTKALKSLKNSLINCLENQINIRS